MSTITQRMNLVQETKCETKKCKHFNKEDEICMNPKDTVNYFTGIIKCPLEKFAIKRKDFEG